ncbi:MAG: CDP-glucose 4,6-dehydratase, partial [Nanoarchaeota archaeon]|nr:CDP-glucose 4,6-dehydratase [Nanoarchaeota archaeon]
MSSLDVYKGKNILVTGHTGFKGAWLSIWLHKLGANVIGFSLEDYPNDYIYKNARLNEILFADEKGDINN